MSSLQKSRIIIRKAFFVRIYKKNKSECTAEGKETLGYHDPQVFYYAFILPSVVNSLVIPSLKIKIWVRDA